MDDSTLSNPGKQKQSDESTNTCAEASHEAQLVANSAKPTSFTANS